MPAIPAPPPGLSPAAAAWFTEVATEFQLDAAGRALLATAADAFTDMDLAKSILATEGLVATSQRGGPKVHPAWQILRDARTAFLRAVAALNLDMGPSDNG